MRREDLKAYQKELPLLDNTTSNIKDANKYEKEPYIMTADISLNTPYSGRGGWSWYTGSAGWMYQGLVQWFLGVVIEKDVLILKPGTPVNFGDYLIKYRYRSATYEIHVQRKGAAIAFGELTVDGLHQKDNRIKLVKINQI